MVETFTCVLFTFQTSEDKITLLLHLDLLWLPLVHLKFHRWLDLSDGSGRVLWMEVVILFFLRFYEIFLLNSLLGRRGLYITWRRVSGQVHSTREGGEECLHLLIALVQALREPFFPLSKYTHSSARPTVEKKCMARTTTSPSTVRTQAVWWPCAAACATRKNILQNGCRAGQLIYPMVCWEEHSPIWCWQGLSRPGLTWLSPHWRHCGTAPWTRIGHGHTRISKND